MKQQPEINRVLNFAVRLAEERKRLSPHQGEFAGKIGISQARQSLYERGERELKADYLELVAAQGLDIQYVITGRRAESSLDATTSALVTATMALSDSQRSALLAFLDTLQPAAASTMHDRRATFAPLAPD
ncbi:helix-turn-helix domain-containing protein [Sphingomonas adhaesiva]|uniref:helix-turn-helix domain-containing protein n=1 Tax=Sphingomonas adhaesiva TaxID=28212 RepID=UPI002FF9A11F